jgi:hypothetical protein
VPVPGVSVPVSGVSPKVDSPRIWSSVNVVSCSLNVFLL